MRALVIESEGVSRFTDREAASPGPGELRISVRHVGLCGSDLNTFRGLNPLVRLPRIPGHEIGGVILEAGPGTATDYAPGRRGIVFPYTSCGTCSACLKGRTNACRHNRTLGVQQEGGLAEEIVLPAEKFLLNDTLDPRFLALVEPLSVGFHAVRRGNVAAEDHVAVLGCGMIGMGVIIAAAARGARVTAIDLSDGKIALAREFGAAEGLNAGAGNVVARLTELTAGRGVDVAFEAVGQPGTFVQAVDLACHAGRVVYVGYAKEPVSYRTELFNLKELDMFGSRNATLDDFRAVIAYLERIGPMAGRLISRVVPFAEAESALPFWDAHRDILKIVVER